MIDKDLEKFGRLPIMKVMLIEDDAEVRDLASSVLTEQGFSILALQDCQGLMDRLKTYRPNAVLLDQVLPGKSGVEAVQEIRRSGEFRRLPIIMVTGLGSEEDKVAALDSGADDYVTKPFLPKELAARIKAVVRRASEETQNEERLVSGPITIDFSAHKVFLNASEILLTLTEFRILSELLRQKGQVLSRERLRERALGNLNVTDRTIDVHMASLRKKLMEQGDAIETVRGVGYRLTPLN